MTNPRLSSSSRERAFRDGQCRCCCFAGHSSGSPFPPFVRIGADHSCYNRHPMKLRGHNIPSTVNGKYGHAGIFFCPNQKYYTYVHIIFHGTWYLGIWYYPQVLCSTSESIRMCGRPCNRRPAEHQTCQAAAAVITGVQPGCVFSLDRRFPH